MRTNHIFNLIVRIGAAAGLMISVSAWATDLTVVIEEIKSTDGTIKVGLFDNISAFPKMPLMKLSTPARPGIVSVVFKDLAPGSYALSAFHDVNNNQRLDRNFLGMPNEAYGFSRGARGMFGPPPFDEACIDIGGKEQHIRIRIR